MPKQYFHMEQLPSPDAAREQMLSHITPITDIQTIRTEHAEGRVLAADIISQQMLPDFRRSTVDGYAVIAADLNGASKESAVRLHVVGESEMGTSTIIMVTPGTCVLVHTGGMVPDGADAVVMVEDTSKVGDEEIDVSAALSTGDNVINVGEDLALGDLVMRAGHVLRIQDIAGLLGLGIVEIDVIRRPKVGIVSHGDEVIPPEQHTVRGQVRDINSYAIAAQVAEAGGDAWKYGIVPDDFDRLVNRLTYILQQGVDMIVLSAGSSVSERDRVPDAINALGEPGVLLHGVATKPGKPQVFGMIGSVPVIGLPGNPVSALVQFMRMGVPVLRALQGATLRPEKLIPVRLAGDVHSMEGREDWLPVKLSPGPDGDLLAEPVHFKSNLIFSLVEADALLKVPSERGSLEPGELVEVRLI